MGAGREGRKGRAFCPSPARAGEAPQRVEMTARKVRPPFLIRLFPGLECFRRKDGLAWRHDLIAGVTLAGYLLPAGIGDASLAGLPPEAGLYACLFAGLMFWLFWRGIRPEAHSSWSGKRPPRNPSL